MEISIYSGTGCCDENDLHCGHNFLQFTKMAFNSGSLSIVFFESNYTKDCTVLIEDSIFSSACVSIDTPSSKTNDSFVQAILNNVTFANGRGKFDPVLSLLAVAIKLQNCTFENNLGSGIQAEKSVMIFQGNSTFKNNSALIGAGILLAQHSYMHLTTDTHILFEDNHADYLGGAIYTDSKPGDPCFFHVDSPTLNKTDVGVSFVRNTADYAGSSIYGNIWSCCEGSSSCNQLHDVFNTSNTEKYPSAISSDPYNICLCEDGKFLPNCSESNKAYEVYVFPGQEFPVRLAVVSERFKGVVIGAVRGALENATLRPHQVSQTSDKPYCKNFNYSVSTVQKGIHTVTLNIFPENSLYKLILVDVVSSAIAVDVRIKDCPLGFSLSAQGSCVCDTRIGNGNIECNIDDQSILLPANSWIGFMNEPASNKSGVIFHPNCPIGYCLPYNVKVTSNTSDSQCQPHRTGLLCGRCEDGYSLTLGNQECAECSNTYLLLIFPLAVAGLLLVVLLFALNLTVTEGSINGLIFYANVIGMTYTALFTGEESHLYLFIAWINLDLGITTCFFTGMDCYADLWLQFVFSIYLWVIMQVAIMFYNKFPALANKLGGENAVKVLATVLLLTYTKLLRTVVTILSFTKLEYPDGAVRYVWLYDANMEFFKGKHLYLGIAGILVLAFLIVPYTLCITFFQQLQAFSGHRLFQWVNKLKPIFDSYAGPYKDKYRFWTGMLLLVRALISILFAINTAESADFNLLIILIVSCILLMAHSSDKYKKWPYNYIEYFFYLQLGVFSGAMFYARHNNGSIAAVADTSIGLALLAFLAVVGYHLKLRMKPFKTYWYRLNGYADIGADNQEFIHERIN